MQNETKEDIVRVLRIVEYVGPRAAVEKLVNSSIHGSRKVGRDGDGVITIRAATIGNYPEVLDMGTGEEPNAE